MPLGSKEAIWPDVDGAIDVEAGIDAGPPLHGCAGVTDADLVPGLPSNVRVRETGPGKNMFVIGVDDDDMFD